MQLKEILMNILYVSILVLWAISIISDPQMIIGFPIIALSLLLIIAIATLSFPPVWAFLAAKYVVNELKDQPKR